MTTVIQMTSDLSFSEIRTMMHYTIATNFGYDLRCNGTNGCGVFAELEVLGIYGKDQEMLTKLFVDSVKPTISRHFGKFEVVSK